MNAMRVGLLTKFLGYLGMAAAAASLFLIGSAPALLIEVFWLIAVAYLLAGRWPNGDPPSWATGKAEPWPTAAELREQRQKARGWRERLAGQGGPLAAPSGRSPLRRQRARARPSASASAATRLRRSRLGGRRSSLAAPPLSPRFAPLVDPTLSADPPRVESSPRPAPNPTLGGTTWKLLDATRGGRRSGARSGREVRRLDAGRSWTAGTRRFRDDDVRPQHDEREPRECRWDRRRTRARHRLRRSGAAPGRNVGVPDRQHVRSGRVHVVWRLLDLVLLHPEGDPGHPRHRSRGRALPDRLGWSSPGTCSSRRCGPPERSRWCSCC